MSLWLEAGGGTDEYSVERYMQLMREEGHIVPKDSPDAAKERNLPCGWPGLPDGDEVKLQADLDRLAKQRRDAEASTRDWPMW